MKLSRQGYGKLVRRMFLEHLKIDWGAYTSIRDYLYEFQNGNKVATFYSSFTHSRWWWGVGKSYWSEWDKYTYMALLIRDDAEKCEYLLMNPTDSVNLLKRITEDNQGKKHIVIYFPSTGKRYLQQWPNYQLDKKIVCLNSLIMDSASKKLKGNDLKRKVVRSDYSVASLKNYIKNLSPEEKEKFINELKSSLR